MADKTTTTREVSRAMQHLKKIILFFSLTLLTACTSETATPSEPGGFSFIVIGDTPYGPPDEVMLAQALPKIRAGAYPFIIHVGDFKGGGAPCTDALEERLETLIATLAPTPVFYTPGDNDWTDCDRFKDPATGVHTSDLDRLAGLRMRFFSAPLAASAALGARRQKAQPENAAWRYGGVQFATLHIVGTNNARDWVVGDPLERAATAADARDAANIAWLNEAFAAAKASRASAVVIAMQADMTDIEDKPEDVMCEDVAANDAHPCDGFTDLRAAIRDAARAFDGPVLVIHGDTAPFTLGQSFAGEEAKNLWRLNAAGDAGVGRTGQAYGTRDVTIVTINPPADKPVAAQGLLTGKTPKGLEHN
jgi:hypothetical protein